jgi:hypothetical protein
MTAIFSLEPAGAVVGVFRIVSGNMHSSFRDVFRATRFAGSVQSSWSISTEDKDGSQAMRESPDGSTT